MRHFSGKLAALGFVLSLALAAVAGDALVDNPKYTSWASAKPGATSVYHEVTKYAGDEKSSLPDGADDKVITYTLLSVNDKQAVVQAVVLAKEFLGVVESAPTKLHYPAKIKKAHLEAVLEEFGAKNVGEEMVMVEKEQLKCKVYEGTHKKGTETIDYKLYVSDKVPGGVVKRTRVAKDGGQVVAETTILLKSFGMGKAKKADK